MTKYHHYQKTPSGVQFLAMMELILEKLLLGITLAAPIGPVSLEMIQRGVRRGFWAAFSIRLGGAVGNTLCLIAAFCGLSAIKDHAIAMAALSMLGTWCLLWIGFSNLAKLTQPVDLSGTSEERQGNGLWLGFMLAVFNPIGLAFWLGSFAQSMKSGAESGLMAFAQNLLIVAGVLLWGAFLSLSLNYGRRYLNSMVVQVITAIAGLLLLGYGCRYSQQPLLDLSIIGSLFLLRNRWSARQVADDERV